MKNPLILLALAATLSATAADAAEVPLYETGPAEDSSFVRFVNGGQQPLEIVATGSNARLTLDTAKPASDFLPIRAGKPIEGALVRGGAKRNVSVTVQPGEFASVVGLDDAAGGLRTVVVHEQPDDFNALKASVAFYNLDAQCASAALLAAGRNIVLLDQVPEGQSKRRQINPVPLSVQLSCAGQAVGQPLDLGTLEAGQRYTVFLVPAGKQSRIFQATDTVAR
ncbi:alginate O-acetyltransferase AlgF [Achromobacter aloeverae]|uniref:Alginate biosynthesis protein AlgF n=1 Tax=Achromobacter aloeverae TaxID=1750518 RepID=A0A4Q1HJA8_9BURK|nr:alginate O-acetyltransferase AlgF [Achromobacter aloeverae]RXN86643.1 cell division protein FtsQ [Achromobacter aloeverae]